MSKAFDTVDRKILFEHLEQVLDQGELYYLSILTNQPQIKIKLENNISEPFTTTQGIMQGDCLSAILFFFYLAKALDCDKLKIEAKQNNIFYIKPKYADDITAATINNTSIIENIQKEYPMKLKAFNLTTNETKTEHHTVPEPKPIPKPPDFDKFQKSGKCSWSDLDWVLPQPSPSHTEPWKNCKLLGSKLDTAQDIKARKGKVYDTMKKLNPYFKSRYLNIDSKMKQFHIMLTRSFSITVKYGLQQKQQTTKLTLFTEECFV